MPVRTVLLAARGGPASFGVQSPDDRLDYAFLVFLGAGETLLSPTVTAAPGDLTIDTVAVSDCQISFWAEGGAASVLYAIDCTVPTSNGRVLAGRASLFVGPAGLDDPSTVAPGC